VVGILRGAAKGYRKGKAVMRIFVIAADLKALPISTAFFLKRKVYHPGNSGKSFNWRVIALPG